MHYQLKPWRCPVCLIRASVPDDALSVRCVCGFDCELPTGRTPLTSTAIWDCPLCQTRHAIQGGAERACVCGTVRTAAGEVVATEVDNQIDHLQRLDLKAYSHSTTGIILRWGRAIGRWVASGRPVRTAEQAMGAWSICQQCEHFDNAKGVCRVCDCRISLSAGAVFNKLAMGTERCPEGRWEAIVEPTGGLESCRGCKSAKTKSVRAAERLEKKARRDRRRRGKKRAARRDHSGGPDPAD